MQYKNTTMMKVRKMITLLAACLLLMSNGQAWGGTRMNQATIDFIRKHQGGGWHHVSSSLHDTFAIKR